MTIGRRTASGSATHRLPKRWRFALALSIREPAVSCKSLPALFLCGVLSFSIADGLLAASGALASVTSGFSPSVYPAPLKAHAHGAMTSCPNPSGLQPFDRAAEKQAVAITAGYHRISLSYDERHSDQTLWASLHGLWAGTGHTAKGKIVIYGAQPLAQTPYASIVRFSCGKALVAHSYVLESGPSRKATQRCSACVSQLFFIDRRNHPLAYFEY